MAGIAATRAEAIRWSLDRVREQPGYRRLGELRGDAEVMDRDVLDAIEREIDQEVRVRFPGSAARQAMLLQYGDDPEIGPGEYTFSDNPVTRDGHGPRMSNLVGERPSDIQEWEHGEWPELARLGPAGLETLDTVIMAGTAATRAQAIRWALDRIRERPAYQRLRELRGEADKRGRHTGSGADDPAEPSYRGACQQHVGDLVLGRARRQRPAGAPFQAHSLGPDGRRH